MQFHQEPQRTWAPSMPVGAYQSYEIRAPRSSHWRRATCEEVRCPNYLRGWQTVVDEGTDQGMGIALYIRRNSGRGFTESRDESGLTRFVFEPGQVCFDSASDAHHVQVRPEIYLVRGGDHRANTGLVRRHHNGLEWVEDFAEHTDKMLTKIERG
jgi:hypothetical protein